jgi:UMP-CMP kinase
VVKISATLPPDDVYKKVQESLKERGVEPITLKFVQN